MGVETKYFPEANVAHGLFSGTVTNEEILTVVREALQRLDATRTMYLVHDYTEASLAEVASRDIRENVTRLRLSARADHPVMLLAVVPGDLEFGLSRMWISQAEGMKWAADAVRSRAEAEALLRDLGAEVSLG